MRVYPQWRWHLDEVFVKVNGKLCYLWRAVDHEGEVLEAVATAKRDKAAALKLLKQIMKKYGAPRSIVTDGLRAYSAAMNDIGVAAERHEVGGRLNNRAENSHQPFRRREGAMQRFRSLKTLQKFSLVHAQVHNQFNQERHLSRGKSTSRDALLPWPSGAPSRHRSSLRDGRRAACRRASVTLTPPRRGKNAPPISPIALEAVKRVDALFDVEREINGLSVEKRLAARRERSAPFVAALEGWMRAERAKLSRHAAVAKAIDYMLTRWQAFTRFLDDGRICLSNNAAERALRGLALGRKSWLFAGSERGAERAAVMYTLIHTAKLNAVDPQVWLADVLARIADHPVNRVDELLPWKWKVHS